MKSRSNQFFQNISKFNLLFFVCFHVFCVSECHFSQELPVFSGSAAIMIIILLISVSYGLVLKHSTVCASIADYDEREFRL